MKRLAFAPVAILALMLNGCGVTAPRGNDGFADLGSARLAGTHRVISLSLGPAVLHFAARFVVDDPETQSLLRRLDGVRVRAYEVRGDGKGVQQSLAQLGDKLGNDGWSPVMLLHEDDELVQMFARSAGGGIHGLVVVSAEDDEVVVINVMGDIEPAQFHDVMLALDVREAPEVRPAAAGGT